jgi:hypothetical protein
MAELPHLKNVPVRTSYKLVMQVGAVARESLNGNMAQRMAQSGE